MPIRMRINHTLQMTVEVTTVEVDRHFVLIYQVFRKLGGPEYLLPLMIYLQEH